MEQGSRAAPGQARHVIERARLNALLDRAVARVVVLFGPAGYGKTTLARQWLLEKGWPVVWYRATSASSDVAALALGVAKSVEQFAQGASRRLDEGLRTLSNPEDQAETLAAMLAEHLDDWPQNGWLAIDDYHLIAPSPSGEAFIEYLAKESPIRLLLMSRTRPSWVSPRALLYGDVLEIGHSALAMTHSEAEEVFRKAGEPRDPSGLVALAEGWPAVIGLAALTSSGGLPATNEAVPAALHAYFADELFQMLPPLAQEGLCYLSIAPIISDDAAHQLLGASSDEVLGAAYRAGFLTRDRDQLEIHPLLRQFLEVKRAALDQDALRKCADSLGRWYLASGNIDEAFTVARAFSLDQLMVDIVESTLDRVLTEGRLSTLRIWLEALRDQDPGHPLAEAGYIEIVFREGNWSEACARAEKLARALPENHPLRWRILYRAGQSAQLGDRATDALRLLSSAERHATSPEQTRRLLWNRFVILGELEEHREAERTLTKYEGLSNPTVEDRLRAIQGRLLLTARWGGVDQELRRLPDCDELLALAARAQDPVARTGFIQTLCIATCLTARYELALELVDRELQDAERARLDFVRPHALTARAVAYFGLRDFRKAIGVIEQVRNSAIRDDDVHNEINSVTILARIFLARNRASQALRVTDVTWPRKSSLGNYGDFLAVRALAFACTGSYDEARELIDASASVTAHSDGRVVRAFASAVIALKQSGADSLDATLFALDEAATTENFDAFVCSYRAYPPLLKVLANDTRGRSRPLRDIVVRRDRAHATRFGLLPAVDGGNPDALSKRETEVLGLIQQGLSNRAIAKTLWISEATVKVHVRSILRKMNVQTRTEAAVLAATRSS